MAKSLSPPPKFTVYKDGVPAVGAKIYTYAGGSINTPIDTYSDYDGTLNSNPVVTDARGEADIWLTPGTSYKFVVKDSANNTIYTVDDIIGPSGGVINGAVTFTGPVTFEDIVNVTGGLTITLEADQELLVTGDGNVRFQSDVVNDGNHTSFINGATITLPDNSVTLNMLQQSVRDALLAAVSNSADSIVSGTGRISFETGSYVMAGSVTGVTTAYYVPPTGTDTSMVAVNDGDGNFRSITMGELSQTLASATFSPAAGAADKNYDKYIWQQNISVSSLTSGSTIATANLAAVHGLITGQYVEISGAVPDTYNGEFQVTVTDTDSFTYAIPEAAASPATGTIVAKIPRFSRGPAWISDTNRGTGAGTAEIERIGNVYVNAVSITNGPAANMGTLVGSVRTNSSTEYDWIPVAAASGGSPVWLGLDVVSNHVGIPVSCKDTKFNWTYQTPENTWRPLDNSTDNRISKIFCLDNNTVLLLAQCNWDNHASPAAAVGGRIGVGIDTTTDTDASVVLGRAAAEEAAVKSISVGLRSTVQATVDAGFHYFQVVELNEDDTTISTFAGFDGIAGISGVLDS